jgi:DNA primase
LREEYRFVTSFRGIQGEKQLPKTHEWLIITKSLKDVMLFRRYGIPAIALQGEANVPDNDLIDKFGKRFEKIIMFYDNDKQGILSMQKAKKLIPCVWIPRKYKVKDITDYYKAYGKDATYELIF